MNMFNFVLRKKKRIFWIIIGSIFITLFWLTFLSNDSTIFPDYKFKPEKFEYECQSIKKLKDRITKCLLDKLLSASIQKLGLWPTLKATVDSCNGQLLKGKLPKIFGLKNKDDEKFIILPNEKSKNKDDCSVLTIGIGDDIECEKQLKFLYPSCQFFGTDPIYQVGSVYKNVGHFWNVAVSDKDGWIDASVLINGSYQNRNVSSKNIMQIFECMNKSIIDFLLLDAEGSEYSILPLLTKKYANFAICQINVELHWFSEVNLNITDQTFSHVIIDFIRNGPYVPISSNYVSSDMARFGLNRNRMFLINLESEYCIEKYYNDLCIDNNNL